MTRLHGTAPYSVLRYAATAMQTTMNAPYSADGSAMSQPRDLIGSYCRRATNAAIVGSAMIRYTVMKIKCPFILAVGSARARLKNGGKGGEGSTRIDDNNNVHAVGGDATQLICQPVNTTRFRNEKKGKRSERGGSGGRHGVFEERGGGQSGIVARCEKGKSVAEIGRLRRLRGDVGGRKTEVKMCLSNGCHSNLNGDKQTRIPICSWEHRSLGAEGRRAAEAWALRGLRAS